MDFKLVIIFSCISLSYASDFMFDRLDVNTHAFPLGEHFPISIDVTFRFHGYEKTLHLMKDKESTNLLSEHVFDAWSILPSGVFKDENRHQFAYYTSPEFEDTSIVIHRENNTAEPKYYGRWGTEYGNLVVYSNDGTSGAHRVRRDEAVRITNLREIHRPENQRPNTIEPTGSTRGPLGDTEECVIETGFVEFDLPGCGCCGGCGCDDTCDTCSDGLGRPSYTEADNCTTDAECCTEKVRVTTLFVPDGCDASYMPSASVVMVEATGWDQDNLHVDAEVFQRPGDKRWDVKLVNTPWR